LRREEVEEEVEVEEEEKRGPERFECWTGD
jgi:hypothetical protein